MKLLLKVLSKRQFQTTSRVLGTAAEEESVTPHPRLEQEETQKD